MVLDSRVNPHRPHGVRGGGGVRPPLQGGQGEGLGPQWRRAVCRQVSGNSPASHLPPC